MSKPDSTNATGDLGQPDGFSPDRVHLHADGVEPWRKPLGQAAAVLVQAVTIVVGLYPLEAWIKNREEARDHILSALADKVKEVPSAELISPRPLTAQSAIEGMAGTRDEPELFDLFANLLANALVRQHAPQVHPGFPSILKHLSASDVRLVRWFFLQGGASNHKSVPCIRVVVLCADTDHARAPVLPFYLGEQPQHIFNEDSEGCAASLNNLERLGLLRLPRFGPGRTTTGHFPPLEQDPFVQSLLERMASTPSVGICQVGRDYVELTDFGFLFCQACLVPPGTRTE